MLDEDGEQVRRVVRYERPRVWSAVVFNATQIDGLPPAPAPPVLAEWERHEGADTILVHSGAAIRHVSDGPPSTGWPRTRSPSRSAGSFRPWTAISRRRCTSSATGPVTRRG